MLLTFISHIFLSNLFPVLLFIISIPFSRWLTQEIVL